LREKGLRPILSEAETDGTVSEPRLQYAALPYRRRGDAVEILLITSLETKRWIIPKGWPNEGRTPPDSAAIEALEEAGVEGQPAGEPIGAYHYAKQRKKGPPVSCRVEVFPLEVKRELESWAEQGQRERRWLTVESAAATVSDPGLADLILILARRLRGPTRDSSPSGN
jgi:8-oxo-dGTP pyrophosphatase MutT (NUDIX family)